MTDDEDPNRAISYVIACLRAVVNDCAARAAAESERMVEYSQLVVDAKRDREKWTKRAQVAAEQLARMERSA